MKQILIIEDLTKNYHNDHGETKALDQISFNVNQGEILGLVGPSGCGKSTLLSIIGKIINSSSGSIYYPKHDLEVGYMLQDDCLFDWLNIKNNCLLGLKIKKILTPSSIKYVDNLLDAYGLKDFKHQYPNNLSGGMRQRVALIRTLAIKPDILLLDEAFSALDYQSRLLVSDDVYNIIKHEQKTAIIVTHDLSEAISMCDRIIVLSKRPATVKSIININIGDNLSPIKRRNHNSFSKYYQQLWNEMDINEL